MEEQIDVLNPDGTFAGYARGRTEVHSKGLWHRTVHIWAFDKNDRILFQLRAKVKENNPGLLDTSCAGHISAGDTSRNAAVRELREELVAANCRRWDPSRLAFLDVLIIQTAIGELLGFPDIPVKVTINEYVEMAKILSTPQSGAFVNGMLDAIAHDLSASGKLDKEL